MSSRQTRCNYVVKKKIQAKKVNSNDDICEDDTHVHSNNDETYQNYDDVHEYQNERIQGTVFKYTSKNKILLRKKQLFEILNDNKLEYVKNGVCDSYIKFGTPPLNNVIDDIKTKTEGRINRLNRLLKRLRKEGEVYDEKNSWYQRYINTGSDINKAVDEGIKEWFFYHKTEYPDMLKMYKNEDFAQTKAFNAYIEKHGADRYTERIRKSEMVLEIVI